MNLGSTLRAFFSTSKPLTGQPMNSSAAPVLTVYRNGAAFAPPTPPALTNPGTGQYRVTLA